MLYIDQVQKIDINDLSSKSKGNEAVAVVVKGRSKDKKTIVYLDGQKNRFGEKKFFICPYCGELRQHLYYVQGDWKCRECGNLKYRSTSTYRKGMDYCDLKIDKILDKLKVEHKIGYYTGDLMPYIKPKKMRWTTYSTLIRELKYWQCERADRWLKYVSLRLRK